MADGCVGGVGSNDGSGVAGSRDFIVERSRAGCAGCWREPVALDVRRAALREYPGSVVIMGNAGPLLTAGLSGDRTGFEAAARRGWLLR